MLTRAAILASALLLAASPRRFVGEGRRDGSRVTPNEDFIKEHPMQGENFDLFKEDWHRRQANK